MRRQVDGRQVGKGFQLFERSIDGRITGVSMPAIPLQQIPLRRTEKDQMHFAQALPRRCLICSQVTTLSGSSR